jgi:hypothetical protein
MRPRKVTFVLLCVLLLGTFVAGTAAFARGKAGVVASFTFSPASPVTGDLITFTSTSVATGGGNSVVSQDWDLNGDGRFDDATGPVVQRSFLSSGAHIISLRVTDAHHNTADVSQTVSVTRDQSSTKPSALLTPFPVVRISGRASHRGTWLSRLSIAAPNGARVVVRCHGHGCPLKRQTRTASIDFDTNANGLKVLRFHRFERRLLHRGVVMKVFVTRAGTYGKYVRLKMRRKRPPLRSDRCVTASSTVPLTCPFS